MVRVPDPGRFELRLPDGAANPYLLQAAILVAGLDGIAHRRDPGERSDVNMYEVGHTIDAKRLPLNLLDALRAFEANDLLRQGLGDEFARAYVKLRMGEWRSYAGHLSDWERQHTLDV